MKPTRFCFFALFLFPILLTGQICGDITITQHPLSTTVCGGLPTTFSVVSAGANLTYQWRKNGTNIANATTPNYNIVAANATDAGSYDVVVSNATCPSSISNAAVLTVNAVPPTPYVGDAHAACGCESATAKAQHRDPITFQPLPNKTFVWYSDPNHEKALLPSTMDGNNISLCNSSTFPPILQPLTSIYAFEIENGCYSPPALVSIAAFPLPTTLPKVFENNVELNNFATIRSCEPVTLTATTAVTGGVISWYASSNRGQLLGTGPTYTATTSGAVFVFDAPENNTCVTGDVLTCYGTPKQINVIILPKPVIDLGVDQVQCNAGDVKTINSIVTNTNIPFEYLWSTGATSTSITVSTPNTYSLSVTNISIINNVLFRCTSSDTIVVSLSNLAVSAGADITTCAATTTITPTVTGGKAPYTYAWSNGKTTPSVSVGVGTYQVTVTDANNCSVSDEIIVSGGIGNLAISAGADITTCAATTTITPTVTGGSAPFTYKWSSGETTLTVTVGAGTYRVSVTDANGCSASDEVVVTTGSGNLAISAGADIATCATAVTITPTVTGGTAPFTYKWSSGQTTLAVTVGVGTYRVSVTDANGCSASDEVIVTTGSGNLAISAGADIATCATTVTITPTVTGGTAPFTYKWSSGQTTLAVTVGVGTYRVSVTDANGCSTSDEIVVSGSNLTISAGADVATCAATTAITPTVSGGTAPFRYLWSSGQTTSAVSVSAGTYRVSVTDVNGCSASDEIIITNNSNLSISAGDDITTCAATATITPIVSGGTAPFTYLWSSGQTTASITVGAGPYRVTVTDANGCSASDTIVVTAGSSNGLLVTISQKNNTCNGGKDGQIFITATSNNLPISYSIDNGTTWSANATFNTLSAGSYAVIVRATGGCTYSKTVKITEPTAITFSTASNSSCTSGSIKIENVAGGNGTPYQYSINNGVSWQTSNTFSNLAVGTYNVRVKDSASCQSVEIKTTTVSAPQALTFKATTSKGACGYGETITISNVIGGVAPYQYSFDGGRTWQNSPSSLDNTAGFYILKVRDANLCTSNTQSIQVTQNPLFVSVQQKNNLCYGTSSGQIYIIAKGGSTPYSYSINDGARWFSTPNFSNLAAGIYMVKVKDAAGCTLTKKITLLQGTKINYTAVATPLSCKGTDDGKITFSSISGGSNNSNNYKYSIDYGQNWSNNRNFKNLEAGIYNVRVKDEDGCNSTIQKIEVEKATPITFETTVQNVTCGSNSNGIIGISNVKGGEAPYKYSKTGGNTNTYGNSYQTSNSFLFLQTGTYAMRVKDNKGCESSIKNVVVNKNCNTHNALQQTSVQKIPVVIYGIAPNPSEDYIRIELNSLKAHEQEFQFFDAFGRPIFTEKRMLDEGIQRVEFDVTNLPQGVYQIITTGSYAKNVQNRFVKI